MGSLQGVIVDIEGASALADFEVIMIMDDSNPYLALLGINSATDMNGIINLKKKSMVFEKKLLHMVVPLDPAKDPTIQNPSEIMKVMTIWTIFTR